LYISFVIQILDYREIIIICGTLISVGELNPKLNVKQI